MSIYINPDAIKNGSIATENIADSAVTVNKVATDLQTVLNEKAEASNVYAKTEVYNKTEIDTMIGDVETALATIIGN